MLPRPDTVLLDRLVEWDALKAAGTPVTAEEFCRRWPDRGEELRILIDRVGHIDLVLTQTGEGINPVIPGYEMRREVGRGGMGVVYEAHDTGLDRTVAIKIPYGRATTPEYLKRFGREARTLAKLRHSNIVPVYSTGVSNGVPYFVMGFVTGGNLAEMVGTSSLTAKAIVALLERVARAVGHAHTLGVVHRDLKPANILLDTVGEPHVSDFGVASLLAGESVATSSGDTPSEIAFAETRLTRTGGRVGTPAYAAPELTAGRSEPPTPAVDVWSLGVVLYECLTGQLPYPVPGERDRPPLAPMSLRPDTPRELEAVVRRCLALKPAERYATASDLADALARVRRRIRMRRTVRSIGRVTLVAALAVAVVAWWFWPENAADRHTRLTRIVIGRITESGGAELVPPTGPPVTHRVRVNEALTRTGVAAGGVFQIESPEPCLVELVPSVPAAQFRLTVQLRHDFGRGDSRAGVYFNHVELADGVATTHRFVFLAFADAGVHSLSPVKREGARESELVLRGFGYPVGAGPRAWDQELLRLTGYEPVPFDQPRPWRTLTLDVAEDRIRCKMDDVTLPDYLASQLRTTYADQGCPVGGLGIYLLGGQVSVRSCRIDVSTAP